jgi:SNF2 family DNA or RNA helicase
MVNDIWVDMPKARLKEYKRLERDMLLDLPDNRLVASNAGAKYLMCRQMANGFVYGEDKTWEDLHDEKMQVVESLIEELQGKPVIVAYQFEADYVRLCSYLKRKIHRICGKTSGKMTDKLCKAWNNQKLDIRAVQPQALSHGMNMQEGGNDIIWLGLTDSLETYLQLNARLHRQGVKGDVRIHRILCNSTVDKLCRHRIESKDARQKSLLEALKEYNAES